MKLLLGNARETWYIFSPPVNHMHLADLGSAISGGPNSMPSLNVPSVLHSSDADNVTNPDAIRYREKNLFEF